MNSTVASTRSMSTGRAARCAGEELLDEIEHVVVAARLAAHVEVAGQLDEARAGDVLGDVLPEAERQDRVAGAVDDERRRAHGRQRAAHVDLDVASQHLRRHPGRRRVALVARHARAASPRRRSRRRRTACIARARAPHRPRSVSMNCFVSSGSRPIG